MGRGARFMSSRESRAKLAVVGFDDAHVSCGPHDRAVEFEATDSHKPTVCLIAEVSGGLCAFEARRALLLRPPGVVSTLLEFTLTQPSSRGVLQPLAVTQ